MLAAFMSAIGIAQDQDDDPSPDELRERVGPGRRRQARLLEG